MLNEIYAAGFFDGEGSIHITKDGRAQISVTQKKTEVLEMFKEKYGGEIYSKSDNSRVSHWKVTSRNGMIKFLTDIAPYSIVKKFEIELGLRAIYRISEVATGYHPLSEEEIKERGKLRYEMQMLRPSKLFEKTIAQEKQYRESVKKSHNFRCKDCNSDLQDTPLFNQIVTNGILICRKCHGKRGVHELKPLTKEHIEKVLSENSNLDDACEKLGIGRAALYKKRKKYGLPDRVSNRGNYKKSEL